MLRLVRFAATVICLGCIASAKAASNWPPTLTLGTASPGGLYYVYGEALAQILTENLGIPVNTLPTQGPVHNVKLVESGGAHLGLVTMGIALQGWKGRGDWTGGTAFHAMRALFPMYDTAFQFTVLRRSGISRMAMLDKLDVGAGPRAGTGGTYVPEILKALGLSARLGYGSWDEETKELLSGRYNALALTGGIPFPAAKELEAKAPLTFLSLSDAETDSIRKAIPELTPSIIPAKTYSSLDKDFATIGVYNFAIGRSDLPDDLVYKLVKIVYQNQSRLVRSTESANETDPRNVVKNTFLPFHPGAVRYYREIGISIPDKLVPTN